MKYINGVSEQELRDKALWAVELDYGGRYWEVVKGSELHDFCSQHEDEISDVDWVQFGQQPKELKPFFDWYEEHRSELPFLLSDIFEQFGEER